MTISTLDLVDDVKAYITPFTPPEDLIVDEAAEEPFPCEDEANVRSFGDAQLYSNTWQALKDLAGRIAVIDPNIFRQRNENGLPIFVPLSLDNDGEISIQACYHCDNFFSEDFGNLKHFYEDVPETIMKLGAEKLRSDYYNGLREKVMAPLIIGSISATTFGVLGLIWSSSTWFTSGAIIFFFVAAFSYASIGTLGIDLYTVRDRTDKFHMLYSITWRFVGTISQDQRKLIRRCQNERRFDKIFLLMGCIYEIGFNPKLSPRGPLVIGVREGDDRYFLLLPPD
jgi:hypothetical protein